MKKATLDKAKQLGAFDMHLSRHLKFAVIDVNDIRRMRSTHKRLLHKSPSYRGRQSSEYYIVEIEGRIGYVRISNHWGLFHTTEIVYNADGYAVPSKAGGFERQYIAHHWELLNGKRTKDGEYTNTSQAGVIWLD